jgi:hypothetical protein
MKEKVANKDLHKISKIITKRFECIFEKKMLKKESNELLAKIESSFKEGRLIYEILPNGKVGFFFTYECLIMHEFKEEFFRIPHCYCVNDTAIRRKFYNRIKSIYREVKALKKIKRMVINIYTEDLSTKKYFIKKGFLTYIELVGKTQFGLRALRKEKIIGANVSLRKAETRDLPKLINLDYASHLADKTSRMREIFMKADGKKGMKGFYTKMFKNKSCIVAKENNKIAGSICYFIDKKNQYGLIASIFVANEFKGMGISKLLYRRLLEEFSKRNLKYYLGSSTTQRVLSLAKKMGRNEFLSAIIVEI